MKLLTCVFVGGVLISCDTWAMPCEKYDASQLAALPVEDTESFVTRCTVATNESLNDLEQSQQSSLAWEHDQENDDGFWKNWTGLSDSPVLSSKSESTFYGLGLWQPDKYDALDIMSFEDAQEWIKSHGLQMSFGVSSGGGTSPRVRLDYRWHDENLDTVFLQVEIPFQ